METTELTDPPMRKFSSWWSRQASTVLAIAEPVSLAPAPRHRAQLRDERPSAARGEWMLAHVYTLLGREEPARTMPGAPWRPLANSPTR